MPSANPCQLWPHLVLGAMISLAIGFSGGTARAELSDLGGDGYEIIPLTLAETVSLAIENNLGVEVQRHAPLIAKQDLKISWGAYDPTVSGDYTHSDLRQRTTNPLFPNESTGDTGKATISGIVPYLGASLSIEYSGSKSKGSSFIRPAGVSFDSGLTFGAKIPLLRNLVWNQQWTQVSTSRSFLSASNEDFRTVLMDTVVTTESLYWSLIAEQERLRVARKSLKTSEALLSQTRTQWEVGVKSKVEVIQSEAGVASRELDVIRADAAYNNAQDALISAIYGVRLTPRSLVRVDATDKPSDFSDYEVDAGRSTELAMSNRSELANLQLQIDRQEIQLRFAKNQRLPQFDLNVSYGGTGERPICVLFKPPDPADPDAQPECDVWDGAFSATHDDWFDKGRQYTVGAAVSIPLGNYSARHSVSKSRLELRRTKTQLIQLHQSIIVEIRRDIRLFKAARKGIDAAERQRIAAAEQLRAERIRLEHGESTPFDVLQKESDLVTAEVAKIEALQLYRTSASQLDRAQGTILLNHNIVVAEVGGLRNGNDPESFGISDLLNPINPMASPR